MNINSIPKENWLSIIEIHKESEKKGAEHQNQHQNHGILVGVNPSEEKEFQQYLEELRSDKSGS
jgi:hypothetical protein